MVHSMAWRDGGLRKHTEYEAPVWDGGLRKHTEYEPAISPMPPSTPMHRGYEPARHIRCGRRHRACKKKRINDYVQSCHEFPQRQRCGRGIAGICEVYSIVKA